MRPFSIPSFLGLRLLSFLAVVYAVVAGIEIWETTESATYNREFRAEFHTDPLEGTRTVEYAFAAEHRKLAGLWVFFEPAPGAARHARLNLTLRREGAETPLWSHSFECLLASAQLCRVGDLDLEKGARYVLTYAMPEAKPGTGWPVAYGESDQAASSLRWDTHVRASCAPSMLWLEREPRFPLRNLLIGAALLLICALAAGEQTRFRWPALIVALPTCILAATFLWQVHLWQSWTLFWPDDYPGLGYQVSGMFTGRITARECLTYFQHDRTGQVFTLPLLIGSFTACGLSLKHGYIAANAFCLAVAAGSLLGLLKHYSINRDRAVIAMILLFFGHPSLIGAVGELQPDLGGVAATMLFIYTLVRALDATDSRSHLGWSVACGAAGAIACTMRLALLCLPLVPVCLFVWSLFCERHRSLRERVGYLIPTVVTAVLLGICWTALGLWKTFFLTWAVTETFMHLFHWGGFFSATLQSMQFSLLLVPVLWRRLFTDRAFAAVTGCAVGLLGLLAYTKQPIWFRYWDPPAAVGVILLIWAFREWPTKDRAILGVACLITLSNIFTL